MGKTTILITEAVEKNLHIAKAIAIKLESFYIPYHFLCKANTVEELDKCARKPWKCSKVP